MGWASGAELADALWRRLKGMLPPQMWQAAARAFVEEFEWNDCDTMLETEVGQVAGIDTDEDGGSKWSWDF